MNAVINYNRGMDEHVINLYGDWQEVNLFLQICVIFVFGNIGSREKYFKYNDIVTCSLQLVSKCCGYNVMASIVFFEKLLRRFNVIRS